ncbi:MAG: hypothetical protein DIU84_00620 [Bacillota bacterium]|nr:MAG: hypothetical protein DIU84_00620 [Bacillota bacterium]
MPNRAALYPSQACKHKPSRRASSTCRSETLHPFVIRVRPGRTFPVTARFRIVSEADDPAVERFHDLLERTFADKNLTSDLETLRWQVRNRVNHRRIHFLVVAEERRRLVGGTLFTYVITANTAFSDYLVLEPAARGRGLGRELFNRRADILQKAANLFGRSQCLGVMIEVANPLRMTPRQRQAEAMSALDPVQRRRMFAHMGFLQVPVNYVQPPSRPGGKAVKYTDLLFHPMDPEVRRTLTVPARALYETVAAVWAGVPAARPYLRRLRQELGDDAVPLVPVAGLNQPLPQAQGQEGQ